MIPTHWLSGRSRGRRQSDPIRARMIRRLLIISAIATLPVGFFWHDIFVGILSFLIYVYLFLQFPVTAFAALAAIVFAIGWYLPIWPGRAWQRASAILVVVIVLHAGWFLYGWVTFHPLCSITAGIGGDTSQRALMGELDPEYADRFERALRGSWGASAVRRPDAHTVLVHPTIALIENEWNFNVSYLVASSALPPQLAERKDADCLAIEQNAMLGGEASWWRKGWGLWPWNTINEDEGFARWLRSLYKGA